MISSLDKVGTRVGKVPVSCTLIPLEELEYEPPSTKTLKTVESSLRVDAIASAGFKISRSKFSDLISKGDVRINWNTVTKNGATLRTGDMVSVSGSGRLKIGEIITTKKGKYAVELIRYDTSSSSSSTATADVGRISFLLENDKSSDEISSSRPKTGRKSYSNNHDEFTHLRRSNSISTAAVNNNNNNNNNNGSRPETGKFWKIGRLFRKKKDKNNHSNNHYNNVNVESSNVNNNEENHECNGVSRSRSLCSFRGFYDTDQENGGFAVSSSSAARASSVSTGNFVLDSAKMSCFSESEARMSNFDYCDASNFIGTNKSNIFSFKETEFVSSEDHAFIDLKLHDMSSETSRGPPDLAAMRRSGLGIV
ncbi:hypothetical protein SOVF_133780 isoform C [Spinacia oleracea]|nr:hypothetical protein SOVF_133780 isoform C [Spinacia oleracea]